MAKGNKAQQLSFFGLNCPTDQIAMDFKIVLSLWSSTPHQSMLKKLSASITAWVNDSVRIKLCWKKQRDDNCGLKTQYVSSLI